MSKVIFVSPHPDDIELFCGGALLEHLKYDEVTVILMTKGGKGTNNPFLSETRLEQIRELEIQRRHELIQDAKLIFAGFKDKEIEVNSLAIFKIIKLIESYQPDLIYLPEFEMDKTWYKHKDHQNTGRLFVKALLNIGRSITVRCYHSMNTNFLTPITPDNFIINNKAAKLYKSQKFTVWRVSRKYNKLRQRWGKELQCQYAEGFREFAIDELLIPE